MGGDFELALRGRWLVASFARPQRVASWAIVGGGLARYARVVWHQVVPGDLPPDVDARALMVDRMRAAGYAESVGLMTGRRLDAHEVATDRCGDASARCVATTGLSNALRAGDRPGALARVGTINALCHVSAPLTDEALLEALAIAGEARTAAVLDAGARSAVSGLPATGTGTDCLAIAAPDAPDPADYAGKHTALGAVIGAAVYRAVRAGADAWLEERG